MYAMCADDWLQEKSQNIQNSQNIHIKEITFCIVLKVLIKL